MNEPRLTAFNEYVNESHTEVTVVPVHPDAASMEFHMGIIGDAARGFDPSMATDPARHLSRAENAEYRSFRQRMLIR